MKVLVTDTQNRVAVALIRELGKKGITVYAGDCDKISTGFFSKYVTKKIVYPDLTKDEPGFIQSLHDFVQKENIDIIFPITDLTVLTIAKHRSVFGESIKIPITDYNRLLNASNKASACQMASKHGIPVPQTYYPESVADLEQVKTFPVVLKPRFSSGSRGVSLCENMDELERQFISTSAKYDGLIVQEYIPIKNDEYSEYDWYGICDWNSRLVAHGCFRRIRSYPLNGGPSTFKESVEDETLNELAEKVLKSLKWQGLAQIDFRIDARNDQPVLMEVNPRPWGSMEHSIRVGMDVAGIWLNLAFGEPVAKQPPIKIGVKSRWLLPGDILWFLSAPKTIKNIKAFFKFSGVDYELIQRGDLKPVFGFFLASIAYLFQKEKRQTIIRKKFDENIALDMAMAENLNENLADVTK